MKIHMFSNLLIRLKTHKLVAFFLLLFICAALCAGAWYGWKEYQYRQSSEYAFAQIKQALTPPNPKALAQLVDFNAITQELAQATSKNFPFFKAGPDQERAIRNLLQTVLLKRFMSKDESKAQPLPESEEEQLLKEVEILPADFVSQLRDNMTLLENGTEAAHIGTKVENPLLKKSFPLVFSLRKTPDGWKITHLANSPELLTQLRSALLERHARLREVYENKNSQTTKRMEQLLPILSCSVDAGLLSDKKTLLMVVQVIARNRGPIQINNFNVDASIMGRNGKEIAQRFLNVAKPIAPGEDFNHRWNFELEANSPLARRILGAGPLQCKATWQTLGLNNAEVLHILEVPNPDRQCAIAGHDHPDGFCLTPVFQQ